MPPGHSGRTWSLTGAVPAEPEADRSSGIGGRRDIGDDMDHVGAAVVMAMVATTQISERICSSNSPTSSDSERTSPITKASFTREYVPAAIGAAMQTHRHAVPRRKCSTGGISDWSWRPARAHGGIAADALWPRLADTRSWDETPNTKPASLAKGGEPGRDHARRC